VPLQANLGEDPVLDLAAGDEQLARGLELARAHGQVDFDPESGEWFFPEPFMA